jgi:hypothetical protein
MRHWTQRVRPPSGPQELQQIRQAGEQLGQHAGRAPGRARVIFQTVSEIAVVGSITIGGILALYHLWDKAARHHGHEPGQEGGGDRPPHRHAIAAAGHGRR